MKFITTYPTIPKVPILFSPTIQSSKDIMMNLHHTKPHRHAPVVPWPPSRSILNLKTLWIFFKAWMIHTLLFKAKFCLWILCPLSQSPILYCFKRNDNGLCLALAPTYLNRLPWLHNIHLLHLLDHHLVLNTTALFATWISKSWQWLFKSWRWLFKSWRWFFPSWCWFFLLS